VRSLYPHARIRSVDSRAAALVPGVKAVVSGADVRQVRTGRGIANTISHALGVHMDTLPLTSESVFNRLRAHDRPTTDP
jgi:CO/xanthine dehydrogenase Mo-binding subunit